MKIEVNKTSTRLPSVRPLLLVLLLCPVGLAAQPKKTASPKVQRPLSAVVRKHSPRHRKIQKIHIAQQNPPAPATEEHTAAQAMSDAGKLTSADFLKAAQQAAPAEKAAEAAATPDAVQTKKALHPAEKTEALAVADKAARPKTATVEDVATKLPILPPLYDRHGRLIVPRPLKGSHEILVHQNTMADNEGLDRIQDDEDLQAMRAKNLLVALPVGPALHADERLPVNRRYARPWTAKFLADMARAHYARFHRPLQVNSAVRTVDFQTQLMRVNGNAAPAEGDTASPHLTGQAVDIAKHELSKAEIAWMRDYLLPLIEQGKVDVEEEFQQACFHVSVYQRYAPTTPKQMLVARRASKTTESALAAPVRLP